MSKEWGIKTGTIYFHIEELHPLITQNEDKHYILTELGKRVSNWFIGTDAGRLRVQKIDSYTVLGSKLVNFYDTNLPLKVIVLIMAVFSLYPLDQISVIVIGSFVLSAADMSLDDIWGINFLSLVAIIGVFYILLGLFEKKLVPASPDLVGYFLFSHIITYLAVSILKFFAFFTSISLSIQIWLVISIVSQITFLSIFSSFLTLKMGIRGERSLLISLLMLYVSVVIALFFI